MKVILTTLRLYLREFIIEDGQHFYILNKDPQVIKYTGDPPFKSVAEAEGFIKNYSAYTDYGYGRWAVCLKENDEFIGFCGLKYHPKEQITEVGFRISKNYWNKGYATESTLACIEYGFKTLKLDTIYAHVHIKNIASHRVIEKCGLTFVKKFMYDKLPAYLYKLKNKTLK